MADFGSMASALMNKFGPGGMQQQAPAMRQPKPGMPFAEDQTKPQVLPMPSSQGSLGLPVSPPQGSLGLPVSPPTGADPVLAQPQWLGALTQPSPGNPVDNALMNTTATPPAPSAGGPAGSLAALFQQMIGGGGQTSQATLSGGGVANPNPPTAAVPSSNLFDAQVSRYGAQMPMTTPQRRML